MGMLVGSWHKKDTTQWRFTTTTIEEDWKDLESVFSHAYRGNADTTIAKLTPDNDWSWKYANTTIRDSVALPVPVVHHEGVFVKSPVAYETTQTYILQIPIPSFVKGITSLFTDWEISHNMTKSAGGLFSVTVDFSHIMFAGAKYFAAKYATGVALVDRFIVEVIGNMLPRPGILYVEVSIGGNYDTGVSSSITTEHFINFNASWGNNFVSLVPRGIVECPVDPFTYASEVQQDCDSCTSTCSSC